MPRTVYFEAVMRFAQQPRRWRHKARGSTYTEIGRGQMQITGPLDMAHVVVYQSEADKSIWVRPLSEFEDGRFEELEPR